VRVAGEVERWRAAPGAQTQRVRTIVHAPTKMRRMAKRSNVGRATQRVRVRGTSVLSFCRCTARGSCLELCYSSRYARDAASIPRSASVFFLLCAGASAARSARAMSARCATGLPCHVAAGYAGEERDVSCLHLSSRVLLLRSDMLVIMKPRVHSPRYAEALCHAAALFYDATRKREDEA